MGTNPASMVDVPSVMCILFDNKKKTLCRMCSVMKQPPLVRLKISFFLWLS